MSNPKIREDGFIFYNGAWRSPGGMERSKEAQREKSRRVARKSTELRRRWVLAHGPCQRCGTWEKLQIDHVDPRLKEIEPSILARYSAERIKSELAKCQVLCLDCHSVKTQEDIRAGLSIKPSQWKTHCRKGHEYTHRNINGHHVCLICARERNKARWPIKKLRMKRCPSCGRPRINTRNTSCSDPFHIWYCKAKECLGHKPNPTKQGCQPTADFSSGMEF